MRLLWTRIPSPMSQAAAGPHAARGMALSRMRVRQNVGVAVCGRTSCSKVTGGAVSGLTSERPFPAGKGPRLTAAAVLFRSIQ